MPQRKPKVAIFTLYPKEGASSNFRILMYQKDLEKEFDLHAYSFWNEQYVKEYMWNKKEHVPEVAGLYAAGTCRRLGQLFKEARRSDVIVFQKSVLPKLPVTMISWLKKRGCRIVFDIDDSNFETRGDNSEKIAVEADVVVAGNEVLQAHFHKINPHTILLPTVDYSPAYQPYIHDSFDTKTIGWLGSKTTVHNIRVIEDALAEVMETHPDVQFRIISNDAEGLDQSLPNTKLVPWTLDGYIESMSDFTLGIMPLEPTAFNKGKCGFKLIQYMNLEKPVIASDVGSNRTITGQCGLIANTKEEWIRALETLLFDKSFYQKCQAHIRSDFTKNYSYENNLNVWKNILYGTISDQWEGESWKYAQGL